MALIPLARFSGLHCMTDTKATGDLAKLPQGQFFGQRCQGLSHCR